MGIKFTWFKKLFSNDPSVSSKRFIGLLGLTNLMIIFDSAILSTTRDFSANEASLFNMMLIVFGILVGGGTIEHLLKSKKK